MNQNDCTINICPIVQEAGKGWGVDQGQAAYRLLDTLVASRYSECDILYLSFKDVGFFDSSFAREGFVRLFEKYRTKKGFCVIDIEIEDLLDNFEGGALRLKQPVIVCDSGMVRYIGPTTENGPSKTNRPILDFLLHKGEVTAADVTAEFHVKLTNASTKLKQLVENGFALRREENADTGGKEFVYYPIR